MYVCMYICMCAYKCACKYVCVYVCVCLYVCTYGYAYCAHTHTHRNRHTHTYTHTQTDTHTHYEADPHLFNQGHHVTHSLYYGRQMVEAFRYGVVERSRAPPVRNAHDLIALLGDAFDPAKRSHYGRLDFIEGITEGSECRFYSV